MEVLELLNQVELGEDTRNQFKEMINNPTSLSAEMVAFCNTYGGRIFVGVRDKDDEIVGLSTEEIRKINQMISNAASEMVHPAINPETEILKLPDEKRVLVITIREGLSKPYFDKDGVIWVKNGADKRRITAREELLRMFQSENYLHADELPVNGLTVSDIDLPYFASIYNKMYNESLDNQQLSLSQLLENMNLMTDEYLNLTGALCFSSRVSYFRPMFIVKAVRYPGTDINMETYMDSRDFSGKLEDVYNGTLGFILSNVPYSQDGQDVNSIARSTVPRIVFEELLVNALTHRDYFVSGAIRVFMFDNRMEIISPGCLPNSLTIANIKAGNSVCRNPILSSYTRYILPYRGLGNGIRRAFQAYQNIDLVNDKDNNLFKAIVYY